MMFIPGRGQVNPRNGSNVLLGTYFGFIQYHESLLPQFLEFVFGICWLYMHNAGPICDGGLGKYPYICWEVGIEPEQLLKAFDF